MLNISILDEIRCTIMAYSNLLLLQVQVQQIECHYNHAQIEKTNSLLLIFSQKKKKKK